jgi:hypothetical protein
MKGRGQIAAFNIHPGHRVKEISSLSPSNPTSARLGRAITRVRKIIQVTNLSLDFRVREALVRIHEFTRSPRPNTQRRNINMHSRELPLFHPSDNHNLQIRIPEVRFAPIPIASRRTPRILQEHRIAILSRDSKLRKPRHLAEIVPSIHSDSLIEKPPAVIGEKSRSRKITILPIHPEAGARTAVSKKVKS